MDRVLHEELTRQRLRHENGVDLWDTADANANANANAKDKDNAHKETSGPKPIGLLYWNTGLWDWRTGVSAGEYYEAIRSIVANVDDDGQDKGEDNKAPEGTRAAIFDAADKVCELVQPAFLHHAWTQSVTARLCVVGRQESVWLVIVYFLFLFVCFLCIFFSVAFVVVVVCAPTDNTYLPTYPWNAFWFCAWSQGDLPHHDSLLANQVCVTQRVRFETRFRSKTLQAPHARHA